MFELALQAGLPIIGVTTDDPANFVAVVQSIAQVKPSRLAVKAMGAPIPPNMHCIKLWWTEKDEDITQDLYTKCQQLGQQVILVNSEERNGFVFDAGELPTPVSMVMDFLKDQVMPELLGQVLYVLKGLSLKRVGEITSLTMARTGGMDVKELRKTRLELVGSTHGLYPVDTHYDFYEWPEQLKEWLTLNTDYFLGDHPAQLVPRGLLFTGVPGVGKSSAAKAIANTFGVPLYRLDVSMVLGKYVGDSEQRMARMLQVVEREAPAVALIDEIDKIFVERDDGGVTTRLLSQLLWWLAEHKSRIFTVMTTNDKDKIPEELYRDGRVDAVMALPRLSANDSRSFAYQVYKSVLGNYNLEHNPILNKALADTKQFEFSHAQVKAITYACIKANKWA